MEASHLFCTFCPENIFNVFSKKITFQCKTINNIFHLKVGEWGIAERAERAERASLRIRHFNKEAISIHKSLAKRWMRQFAVRDLETKQKYHCNVFKCIPSESCLARPIYNPGRLDVAEKCNITYFTYFWHEVKHSMRADQSSNIWAPHILSL